MQSTTNQVQNTVPTLAKSRVRLSMYVHACMQTNTKTYIHYKQTYIQTYRYGLGRTDPQTDRPTDRPTDRQTDRPTDRQTDNRPTDRQTDRPTDRRTDRQTDRQADRQIDRQTDRVYMYSCACELNKLSVSVKASRKKGLSPRGNCQ